MIVHRVTGDKLGACIHAVLETCSLRNAKVRGAVSLCAVHLECLAKLRAIRHSIGVWALRGAELVRVVRSILNRRVDSITKNRVSSTLLKLMQHYLTRSLQYRRHTSRLTVRRWSKGGNLYIDLDHCLA